jgi:molybdate transport system ATP-binding protein
LIRLRGVNVYLGRRRVLRDLSWTLGLGEQWAVLGPNGSGKSTLLKTIVGDLHAVHGGGVGRFEGEAVSTLWEIRSRVGYLAADFQSAYETEQSVRWVVASGFFSSVGLVDTPSDEQWTIVDELLVRLGLGAISGRSFDTLSYGTRRRVLLGRALVHRPRLVVLDEPFDGLDAESRQEWGLLLGGLVRSGVQLVMVTHHLEDVPSCFTHALWMAEGEIVETRRIGSPVTSPERRSTK